LETLQEGKNFLCRGSPSQFCAARKSHSVRSPIRMSTSGASSSSARLSHKRCQSFISSSRRIAAAFFFLLTTTTRPISNATATATPSAIPTLMPTTEPSLSGASSTAASLLLLFCRFPALSGRHCRQRNLLRSCRAGDKPTDRVELIALMCRSADLIVLNATTGMVFRPLGGWTACRRQLRGSCRPR
jgi:hypothetical protein